MSSSIVPRIAQKPLQRAMKAGAAVVWCRLQPAGGAALTVLLGKKPHRVRLRGQDATTLNAQNTGQRQHDRLQVGAPKGWFRPCRAQRELGQVQTLDPTHPQLTFVRG